MTFKQLLAPQPDPEGGPVRPWQEAWPYPLVAGATLGAAFLLSLDKRQLLLLPLTFLLAGLWQAFSVWRRLQEARRLADSWFRSGVCNRARWRACELTSERARARLASSLKRLVSEVQAPRSRSATVFYRPTVYAHRAAFLRIARRLRDLDQPLSPQAVVLLNDLLQDGDGPLFRAELADEAVPRLRAVARALELPAEPEELAA